MRSLRTTMIAGVSALAIGSTVALAGPALAADTGDDAPRDLGVEVRDRSERSGEDLPAGVTPATPVPEGVTIIDGGVLEDPLAFSGEDLPDGVTPAQPVPEGATVIEAGPRAGAG